MCVYNVSSLARKLAEKWHLNVAERRSLPAAGLPASAFVEAIRGILSASPWYPADWPHDEEGYGEIESDSRCEDREPTNYPNYRWESDFIPTHWESDVTGPDVTGLASEERIPRAKFRVLTTGLGHAAPHRQPKTAVEVVV